MRTFTILLFIFGMSVESCDAVAIHEGGTAVAECKVPTSTRRTSPVYWYTYKFSEYLTEDYRVTVKRNLTENLINRLQVAGDNGNYNLKILNVTYEDAGQYSCGFYTTGNRWVTKATENIIIHAPVPPDPSYPLCATEPSDQLYPGMEVRLICVSRGGAPPASLRWYRDGIPLQTISTDFEGYHERILTAEDNGVTFVCKSTSPGVGTVKECFLTPLRLVPHVRIYANTDPVPRGGNVEFKCEGEGEPSIASFIWYWNGELVEENDRLIISGDKGEVLTVKSAKPRDNNALILCVILTSNDLRNTDHLRLRVIDNSDLQNTTPGKPISPALGHVSADNHGLSVGAVLGFIFVGMLISILIFGIYYGTVKYKKRHHGNMEFTISLNHLNNFRHNQTQNDDELTRLNQTHNNKTCNLGMIDLVATQANQASGGIDTDYDHISGDNDSGTVSFNSDHKQIDEPYACADFKPKSQIDNLTYATAKEVSAGNLEQMDPNHAATANKTSEYEFPHEITPTTGKYDASKTPRVRSKTDGSDGRYQKPRRMPKIREDSKAAPLQRRNLAHSLPDLTPSTCLVPMDIDLNHHDYVNMGVTSPTTKAPDYHDYVNYTQDVTVGMRVARSDSSSSGYGEEPESPRLTSASPTKKLSYAELEFTEQDGNNSSTENIIQTCSLPWASTNAETCAEPTSYSRVAYVFKDRRQQSEPSVQRIGGVNR